MPEVVNCQAMQTTNGFVGWLKTKKVTNDKNFNEKILSKKAIKNKNWVLTFAMAGCILCKDNEVVEMNFLRPYFLQF